jgi:hypothetical protein
MRVRYGLELARADVVVDAPGTGFVLIRTAIAGVESS